MGMCGRLQLVKYKIEHLEWDIRIFPYVLAFTNVIIFQKKKLHRIFSYRSIIIIIIIIKKNS